MDHTEKYTIMKYGMIAVFIIAMILILMLGFLINHEKSGHTEVGRILSKSILGINSDGETLIAYFGSDGLNVLEDKYRKRFRDLSSNFSIDDTFEITALKDYYEIQYMARIRLYIRDITVEYSLKRDEFDLLRTGVVVKFELDSEQEDTIKRLIEY